MSKFDIDEALKNWRSELKKQQGLEPGYIAELESNLLDRFDDYVSKDMPEEEAFKKASQKSMADPEEVADEFFKARTPIAHQTPPWKGNAKWIELLPSYLKVAFRNFKRKKGYTFINYLGLTIGLLTVCFVGLYLNYELSWDKFHSKSDRTYRIGQDYRSQSYSLTSFDGYYSATREVQLTQIEGFKNTVGVEDVAHFWIFGGASYLNFENRRFNQDGLLTTNTPKSFFNIFDWKFISGSADKFSSSPGHAVLTEKTARKIISSNEQPFSDLLGKIIRIDSVDYEIAGILENIPSNSHYEFDVALHDERIAYWGGRTYALLSENADIQKVKKRWESNIDQINPRAAQNETGLFNGFDVYNIEDIHLEADALYEVKTAGEKKYLYIFGIIGSVILLITFSNYTNLSIAMYSGRNREIGMRKVMGAGGLQVSGQFLMEAVLISILAIPLVLLLVTVLLPYFNQFMAVQIDNLFYQSPLYLVIILLIAVLIGLVSGVYPAVALSGKKIRTLFDKQISKPSTRGFTLRKGLITFQFVLLIGLGSVTWFINNQLSYINDKDIGYEKDGIVYVLMEDSASYARFGQLLATVPGVNEVGSGTPMARRTYNQTTYSIDGFDEIFDDGYNLYMNPSALKAYGITTTVDEYFEGETSMPERVTLINDSGAEKFSEFLGVQRNELIGKTLRLEPEFVGDDGIPGIPLRIDGFFEDINMFSLKEKIDPYFMQITPNTRTAWAVVNFNTKNISSVMAEIEDAYEQLGQSYPIIRQFQEDRLNELYAQDNRVASLTIYLSVLAFLVALMGLIGLSAYLTSIRKKEIGVRKVLGASNPELVFQLNKEYFYLIGIALLVASPVAYLGVKQWLSNFAYQITINPIIFLVVAIITLLTAALAVTSQTLRAASSNPVQSLRNEQ